MDARSGRRFWLEHSGWLALTVLLPAIPFLIVYTTYPSMPGKDWAEFRAESRQAYASRSSPMEISLLVAKTPIQQSDTEDASTGGESGGLMGMGGPGIGDEDIEPNILPNFKTLDEERELQMEFIERQLQSIDSQSPHFLFLCCHKKVDG